MTVGHTRCRFRFGVACSQWLGVEAVDVQVGGAYSMWAWLGVGRGGVAEMEDGVCEGLAKLE